MRFRATAFGLHLSGSACALTLILGGLYLGWYRWPGWYLSSVLHVVGIVVMVDLVIGPTLTLIIANPNKPRRELARDVGMIVAVQLAALIYGATTLWSGRPLYYTFSLNRLETVQASDLDTGEITLAQHQNPSLAPHWYSRPRWVWAPLPENPQEAMNIVESATIGGGKDVIDMPRYFEPWAKGLPTLRERLTRLDDVIYFSKAEKQSLRTRMSAQGLSSEQRNTLVLWGGSRRLLAVFDPATLHMQALLRPD
ncbi:MAG TPA: hypothetical protein VEK10_09260 [Steroidobacteraceae bacterium]|nr:hypothetical protein [Steroidobacteraceae bacterium]